MWLDYANFGGPADPTKAQPPEGRWSLAFCVIQYFGRFPWLAGTKWQAAGGLGWDPCLPYPGTPGYAMIEAIVLEAEKIIEQMPEPLDERLHGYPHGQRVPSGLNAHWSNPLDAIDGSGELRDGLVAKLRKATLEKAASFPLA
jgi:hypothetical protein